MKLNEVYCDSMESNSWNRRKQNEIKQDGEGNDGMGLVGKEQDGIG